MIGMTSSQISEAERIAIEDTQRWLMQAVVGLNLCPFAKAVVTKKLVRYRVCLSTEPADVLTLLREELQHLASTDESLLDTTLLIAPHLLPDFYEFNAFLSDCEDVLLDMNLEGVLQIADFHPHYTFAGEDPQGMSHFTNRTPYPTLHLLRESSIDKAVAAYPDAALIYERNMALLEKMGPEGWAALGLQARVTDTAQ
ncbi:MAG: hypothetical protein RI902_1613 [Pseudomonadota bacterium]|jgi:hypothetical protein